jgi:hypothetical protein
MYWLLMTKSEKEHINNYFKNIPFQLQISRDTKIMIEIMFENEIQQIINGQNKLLMDLQCRLCRNSPHGSPHQSYLICR